MKRLMVVLVLALCGVAKPGFADKTAEYRSRVVRVVDGDTLVVSNKVLMGDITLRGEAMVRLDSVKAPELDQPGGQEARSFLESLVKDKEVLVIELTDRGKSRGAWVFVGQDEKSVNALLIEEGLTWLTEPRAISVSKSRQAHERMKDAFQKAKDRKRGIWAAENPIPPWEWAKQRKNEQK